MRYKKIKMQYGNNGAFNKVSLRALCSDRYQS